MYTVRQKAPPPRIFADFYIKTTEIYLMSVM